ncbi:hypothetical protein AYO45_05485 [Gammaproteobacteria bacterium SCGC AG-212-F23]|nr:hypothetical protein AYO45_05485 [Gammaproteobacteria bacterium SCGC AG-212-F23]
MNKNFSFPKNRRLLLKTEFQSVFDHSKKVSHPYFLVLYHPNQLNHAKLGVIIGKRIAKTAVRRNMFKRIVRESFRTHQEKINGFNIIVMARQGYNTTDKQKLREGIDRLWEKLKI